MPNRRRWIPSLFAFGIAAASLLLTSSSVVAKPEAEPITEDTAELTAGTWSNASSGANIEFTVEDGWYMDGPPLEDVGVALAHAGYDGAYLAITNFLGRIFADPCATAENASEFFEGTNTVSIEPTAQSFADYLDAHPYVTVSAMTPVEIGGYSGVQVDMRSSVPAECEPPRAWLWVLPVVGDFHLDDAEDARFIALDVDGHVTVIAAEAFTGPDPEDPQVDWDGFLAELTALTDSMVITPA